MSDSLQVEDAPEMVAGLTPKAIRLMVQAEELRRTGAEADSAGVLPAAQAGECAALIVSAFASAARSNYRPDGTKPVFLGISALKMVLAEFPDFPEQPTRLPARAHDLDGYDLLVQWAIERKSILSATGEEQAKYAAAQPTILGTEVLWRLYNDGIGHILPSNDVPEDPSGARIEACVLSVAKACRVGPFSGPDAAQVEVDTEAAAGIANDIIVAHNEFFEHSTQIAEEIEEQMSIVPGKTVASHTPSPAKGRR